MLTLPKNENGQTEAVSLESRRFARLFCTSFLLISSWLRPSLAVGQMARPVDRLPAGQATRSAVVSPTLVVGDLIDLEVFDTPELTAPRLRIDQDGTIAVPVVGNVKVAGLTPLEANALVERRFREAQIMTNPSVMILVLEYATVGSVDVLGEVRAPGIYSFLGPHSLYDALSAAGGLSPTQGGYVTVTHHEDPTHPVVLKLGGADSVALQNSTIVQSGDVVEVSHADAIYVVGDVLRSGQFPLANGKQLTALNALALGGGPTKTSKLGSASIVRTTPTGIKVIPVNLYHVEKASADDPVLLPDDVLVVPSSFPKAFLNVFLPGAAAGVVAALAYGYLR